jgi:hypothetical protein
MHKKAAKESGFWVPKWSFKVVNNFSLEGLRRVAKTVQIIRLWVQLFVYQNYNEQKKKTWHESGYNIPEETGSKLKLL